MITKFHTLKEFKELLKDRELLVETGGDESSFSEDVRFISFNSQDIKQGTLFVCKGVHFKQQYLADALEKGAFAYIGEKKYGNVPESTPFMLVNDIRKAMIIMADFFYDKPYERLTVVGITGTKGKSSTTYFMKSILDDWMDAQGKPESAVVSGIDNYDGIIKEESHLTTPEALELYMHFDNALTSGIEHLSMEVSSTALKFGRVSEVMFDIGCFLNLGEDHISDIEHPDFNDYADSKMILFGQCKNAVVNMESEHAGRVIDACKKSAVLEKLVTFGRHEGVDFYGHDIETSDDCISFKVKSDSFDEEFKITMHGLFNVDNALAAIAMSTVIGVPIEYIKSGLYRARVSGRMEIFTNPSKTLSAIVDYAHNKLSFETLFEAMKKEYPDKKMSIVFGCPGGKALGRRTELTELAGRYCDRIYFTEEDAGEEPVEKICEELARNIEPFNKNYEIITDREKAIEKAIDDADENTLVLITGKGRETRQKRGTLYIDTPSDVEIVERVLKNK